MKLQNQYCNLQQSKKLKELGVSQEAHMYHREEDLINGPCYAAFSVAELGVMLPKMFASRFGAGFWICYNDEYLLENESKPTENFNCNTLSNSEAEARATMLIHLIETGTILIEEVNQRLAAA